MPIFINSNRLYRPVAIDVIILLIALLYNNVSAYLDYPHNMLNNSFYEQNYFITPNTGHVVRYDIVVVAISGLKHFYTYQYYKSQLTILLFYHTHLLHTNLSFLQCNRILLGLTPFFYRNILSSYSHQILNHHINPHL